MTSLAMEARMGVAIALSAVVHKYGEVLAARGEDGAALRDGPSRHLRTGPSGLLRVNGGCVLRDGATPPRLLRASGMWLFGPPQGERNPIMAYAQDDGFFERDRDGGSEGTEPRWEGA